MDKLVNVAILWASAPGKGSIQVHHGRLAGAKIKRGRGTARGGEFSIRDHEAAPGARLELAVRDARMGPGSLATRITIRRGAGDEDAFTFFLRDVSTQTPMWLPQRGVAITAAYDPRDYTQVEADIRGKNLVSELQLIEDQPEETYENACAANRDQVAPLWLGLSRDLRNFSISYDVNMGYFGLIEPLYHCNAVCPPETERKPMVIGVALGRGAGCRVDIKRRLDQGVLPILRATQTDGDVAYHLTAFVTLEKAPLGPNRLRGSHYLALYANSAGNMLTEAEKKLYSDELDRTELVEREEETVCCLRVEAVNSAPVPRYAFIKGAYLRTAAKASFDAKTGLSRFDLTGRVFSVERLNGDPMPARELAVLLPPGGKLVYELIVPHQPLDSRRAAKLATINLDDHLRGCRGYWGAKLASAAFVRLPEPAIDERVRAGLLHLDIISYGLEPKGPVAACVGVYSPIGSETSPIVQFYDSMGWHDLAARSLQFFFERQREDGFIQTFGGYQLETGPVLWSAGEHYRYTRDDRWARSIRPNVLKACDYLLNWRNRNKKPQLRGNGYGLLDGKVADPEDFFHSFMLNGLSYAGIQRSAELLAKVDPANARRLAREAQAFRADIRTAFVQAVARSPLVPTGDGSWVSSTPPWSEYPGPVGLFAEGGEWFTHGAIGARDSLIGATYLVLGEVFDANEPLARTLLAGHQEINTLRNAGFSQPYYCRHDYVHARRGEVKPFLKTYYNQFTALQDRQSYSFWEHYFHASPHKTHEEGWFLMQTRWMLYLEQGDTLRLLPLIPRRWLADGKRIAIDRMASYFGPFSLEVVSELGRGRIRARVRFDRRRGPAEVTLRLPHPDGRRAGDVTGGVYDELAETVRFKPAAGGNEVTLTF